MLLMIGVAVFAGIASSVSAIAYRWGENHRINVVQICTVASAVSAVFFALKVLHRSPVNVPFWVIVIGAVGGLSMYGVVRLFGIALARGPLSPAWCAMMLAFVPVILCSDVFFGEKLHGVQHLGVLAAVSSVLVGSLQHRHDRPVEARRGTTGTYAAILVLLFGMNGVGPVCIKYLTIWSGAGPMDANRDLFLVAFFAVGTVFLVADLMVTQGLRGHRGWWAVLGAMASFGAIVSMWAQCKAAVLPAAVVFTVCGMSALVTVTVASVALFREKITAALVIMLVLGVAAIMLVNFPTLWQVLAAKEASGAI